MDIFMIINIFIFVFCVFMCFRIKWVYKIRKNNTDMVGELMKKRIENGFYNANLYQVLFDFNEYADCIWSYDKIVFHFWIWDLRRMVIDRERFDELYRTPESDDLEAIRKKVIPNTHVANLSGNREKQR